MAAFGSDSSEVSEIRPRLGRERFLTLEGLRGVSALAVLGTHMGTFGGRIFSHGYLAVDLFFLMSGVVIAHAYEQRLTSGWPARRFLLVRFTRLYPLYLLGALLGVGVAISSIRLGPPNLPALAFDTAIAALCVPQLFSGAAPLFPLNPPSWSLFCEAIANLAYARCGKTLKLPSLAVFTMLAAAALATMICLSPVGANVGVKSAQWLGGLTRIAFSFPLGLILYRTRNAGRLRAPSLPAAALLAVVLICFMGAAVGPIYDLCAIFVVFPLVVASALQTRSMSRRAEKTLLFAGAISYPLYALHYPIATLVCLYMPPRGWGAWTWTFGGCVLAFAAAYGALRLFDEPLQALWRSPSSPFRSERPQRSLSPRAAAPAPAASP